MPVVSAARRERVAALAAALGPAAAMAAVFPFAAPGPEGLFQSDLAGLAVAAATGAWLAPRWRCAALRLPSAALLAGATHALLAGSTRGAAACALLVFAVAAASSGLAAVARRLETGEIAGGALAAAVLWVAMSGLSWADDVADRLPAAERHPFRQAVLDVDPATAQAYASGFVRLHAPRVYREVPLATSLVRPPDVLPAALAWTSVAALAWLAALIGRRRAPA